VEETWSQKIGSLIAGVGIVFPSMILAGFMPDWNVLPLAGWIAISATAGAVGACIAWPPRIASFLRGAIAGIVIPFALIPYVAFRLALGNTFFNLELIIPGLIGALPGWLAYKGISWAFTPGDDGFSPPPQHRPGE